MRLLRSFVYTFLLVLLSSCMTAYQRAGLTGGYTETRLGENVWRVFFVGNGFTNSERAIDFALLRSAGVCLESGYRYFIIAEATNVKNVSVGSTGKTVYTISRPSSTNTVVCFTEKPSEYSVLYDARFIVDSIRKKYGL